MRVSAYAREKEADARAALEKIASELERINVDAARSMREGLDETLTLHRLKLPMKLRRSLHTTNPIESTFARGRVLMRHVKRWQNSHHIERWFAAIALEMEEN